MSSRKKRVRLLLLSFIFSPNVGGVESHLDELCQYLVKNNVLITVITYQPIIGNLDAPFKQRRKGMTIYRIPWIRWNLFNKLINHPLLQILYLTPGILAFSIFYLVQSKRKIDVIQAHGFNMAIVAFVLSLFFRIRFTVNTHVSFAFKKPGLYSTILSYILNRSSKVLVLTDDAKNELVKVGVVGKKIAVYHYWVDAFFKPYDKKLMRKQLSISHKNFVVLFVGRFIKEKGVMLLVNAFKNFRQDVELIMIGTGPLEGPLHARKNAAIRVYSSVDRSQLPQWYSAADITIIPSFNASSIYSEGIPRVMIESLSCGTPVVATKAGGLKSMLNDDVGYFIEPKKGSITQAVNFLKSNKSHIRKLAFHATEYVSSTFSINKNGRTILSSIRK